MPGRKPNSLRWQATAEQIELQTNGPLEGTGMGLEVALAPLSLNSLPHSASRTGSKDWALDTRFIHEATHLPSLGQSLSEGSLGPLG